jgi:hypothetical protein
MKAKLSTRKREHSLNKNRACLSPKQIWRDPIIYYSKQNKIKLKVKVKLLQEKHIGYEAIKI